MDAISLGMANAIAEKRRAKQEARQITVDFIRPVNVIKTKDMVDNMMSRIENLSKYSTFTPNKHYNKLNPHRGRGINFKRVGDDIRVKLRSDLFIHIKPNNDIYIMDSVLFGGKITNLKVCSNKDTNSVLRKLEMFLDNPKRLITLLTSIHDPIIAGRVKIGNSIQRDDKGNVAYLRQSDISMLVSENISLIKQGLEPVSFAVVTKALEDRNLQPKMR